MVVGRSRARTADTGSTWVPADGHTAVIGSDRRIDEDWLDPNYTMGLWEHQLDALDVASLRHALEGLHGGLPIEVEYYDGMGNSLRVRAMHIDVKGKGGQPTALVITVA